MRQSRSNRLGPGVEFDPGAGRGAGVDDGALVHFVGFAFEERSYRSFEGTIAGRDAGAPSEERV